MIEDVLTELGVRIASISDHEVSAFCPVHLAQTGREQSKPKWYMNRETGAWICFTCGQRGSLPMLVEALGGDPETIDQLKLNAVVSSLHRWAPGEDAHEDAQPEVSPDAFDANPRPPKRVMQIKDVSPEVVEHYNARWDANGKCWLLPIYTFNHLLAGWQEKSKGYFMNVPKKVKKSQSLFGWHTYNGGPLVVVESPLDAMRFATHGHPAVATYGSSVSDAQTEHIDSAQKVIIAFDNDDAGDHAKEQLATALIKEGHPFVRGFVYPKRSRGYDPGELEVKDLHTGIARARMVYQANYNKENEYGNRTKKRHPQARRALRQRR